MRQLGHAVLLSFLLLFSAALTSAQNQTARRDPDAATAVNAAIIALGSNPSHDSELQATVSLVNGDSATLSAKNWGADHTMENVESASGERRVVYSGGRANIHEDGKVQVASDQLASSSNSCLFLLPLLVSLLQNGEMALEYVGLENSAFHVRFWNTFASKPELSRLAPFTKKDLWIDAGTGLPSKIAFEQKTAEGPVAGVAVAMEFSNYQTVGGVKYPFTITKSVNGVTWGTINVQQVEFNTGLNPADFPIQ